ncbi:topoisomerase II [Shewanella sp. Iso12]|uniref:topoisomerase II n=1 Tax=Shewanella sp. Iso12 TaxID=1826753 RepID=UPI001583F255|nr:topoisomerase II [Shewanella sp. Iso12]
MMTLTKDIQRKEEELSLRLEYMREEALVRFSQIVGRKSTVHQMHAHIGRNNNTFVDSVRMQFHSPEDFIARWLNGLTQQVIEKKADIARRRHFGDRKRTEEIIPEMLQDELLHDYIHRFLERNFYRNFEARVRAKPDQNLWQVWFGSGKLVWGLLISPTHRFGEWTNDKSQMRRENYAYWTVEHVLETGLIAPESEEPVIFPDIQAFLTFYQTVLARVSNSEYEQAISTRYLDYIRESDAPESVPLLIPELRYVGKEVKHLYRLDFSVLNPYTMRMLGFEISPASSHMSIAGSTKKTQKTLNEELSAKWSKEADKRNAYFEKYGITTVTFTDTDLTNVDQCWEHIKGILEERSAGPLTVEGAERELQAAYASVSV